MSSRIGSALAAQVIGKSQRHVQRHARELGGEMLFSSSQEMAQAWAALADDITRLP